MAFFDMLNRNKIFIIIPAYNEERTIGWVVEDVEPYVDKIIVVDDGSVDRTVEKIKSKKAIILRHPINLGQGAALETGFEYARSGGADIVITYDADGQHLAADIPTVLKPILEGKADVVLGSRFLGNTINIPFIKLVTLKLGVLFTALFSNVRLTDTHNGFRALNEMALSLISLKQSRMAHASEFIDEIKSHNLRFVEVPITIKYDSYSKNKGQKATQSIKIFWDLIFDKLK